MMLGLAKTCANPFARSVVRQPYGVCFKRKRGLRQIAPVRCDYESTSDDLAEGTSAVEFMEDLAKSEGIRFEIVENDEEDEEDWDDLVEELGDPSSLGTLGLKGIVSAESDIPSAYAEEIPPLDSSGLESLRNDREVVLLDVRSSVEYAAGHMEGSLNIPIKALQRDTLKDILAEQGSVMASEYAIVVVDSGDHRSKQAFVRLSRVFRIEHVYCCGPYNH
ncbi:hypothetical protein BSKO_07711 [Bryopsis sp. KO-2023]|nr:hypothetical protein BSKO_07711 [Bryopsis sp. KO-2023]